MSRTWRRRSSATGRGGTVPSAGGGSVPTRRCWDSCWVWSRRRSPRSDRKSTRLNSSHVSISYAVFCLKKKKKKKNINKRITKNKKKQLTIIINHQFKKHTMLYIIV